MTRPRVLFAHERSAIRRAVEIVLAEEGFDVQGAADGDAVLAQLRCGPLATDVATASSPWDGVVLDVGLPGAPVFELVHAARAAEARCVLLVASIHSRSSYRRRPTQLHGADGYIEIHRLGDDLAACLRAHTNVDEAGASSAVGERALARRREEGAASEGAGPPPDPERLAALLVSDLVLAHGDVFARGGPFDELEAALDGELVRARARLREAFVANETPHSSASSDEPPAQPDRDEDRDWIGEAFAALGREREADAPVPRAPSPSAAEALAATSLDELDPAQLELWSALERAMRGDGLRRSDPALVELAMMALAEPVPSLAVAGATALRFVGGRAAVAPLFLRCGTPGLVGEVAADAIAEITLRVGGGRHDALDLLVGTTWPDEGTLAQNLCRIAARLASLEHVAPLVALLGSRDVRVRVAAALALGRIHGEHEGVAALCFALADEAPTVRAASCRALASLRAPRSYEPLSSATADPSPLVRAAAIQALVSLDNPAALARLREIILDDPSPAVIVHAIAGLGASRLEQDLGLLMSLCASEDHEVTKAAARALQAYPAHRATAALLGLVGHARWDVRLAAAEVLAIRGDATALASLRSALRSERDALVRDALTQAIRRLEGEGRRGP